MCTFALKEGREYEDSKKNLFLLFAFVAIVVVGAIFMLQYRKGPRNPQNRVAEIAETKNLVENRYAGEIQWRRSNKAENLFEEDAVKTHSEAIALISFEDSAW